MKVRDSGMPNVEMWESFFNIENIFQSLEIDNNIINLVEIGCGYGTFTILASNLIKGKLFAFDIECEMIEIVKQKAIEKGINNIILENRDVHSNTTGLPNVSVDYVMLFNLLHNETPKDFLNEAFRILISGGKLGIIHWRSDIETPRGPDLTIRPKPEEIISLIDESKFKVKLKPFIIEPYHFGILLTKNK
ncbi:MAG: class I SAM-dependent methyltransferase [Bacteroidia bacterium]|nr:class I SAM-dependent methyltransferase [Bacteroidia bacterium]